MGCGASQQSTNPSGSIPQQLHSPQPRRAPTAMNTPMASQPVSLSRPFRHGAPITQGDLNNMRTEFWTSRVDGNAQTWQTLRSVCEALIEEDLSLANAILEATSLITPNGSMEVVYDERGHQYKLPQYCYARPVELVTQPGLLTTSNSNSNLATRPAGNSSDGVVTSKESAKSGKSQSTAAHSSSATNVLPNSTGSPLALRIRVNPGDHNVTLTVDSNYTILNLKQVLTERGPSENTALTGITVPRQRIIYMGKVLHDQLRLCDAKFDDTKVVQVFLKPVV